MADKKFLPLECVHSLGDSLTFVYMNDGLSIVRKEIKTGQTNENFVVIENGLEEGEEVFLSVPKNSEKSTLVKLEKKVAASTKR